MTIHSQTKYLMAHPAFRYAINQYNSGNEKEMEILLTNVQFHCVDVQIKNSAKEFGLNKRMLASDIKSKLINCAPPDNLNVQLPIPQIVDAPVECKVIELAERIESIKKRVAKVFNPKQLFLVFPEILQA